MQIERDPELWRQAKTRAGFKVSFLIYILGVMLMWIVWAVTWRGYPWPIWPTLGWGIGVLSHYLGAYRPGITSPFSAEREYERMTKH